MNVYQKYCPNVWLAACESQHKKGDIIPVANKYGQESDCEVHNYMGVSRTTGKHLYSITRCDGLNKQTYAQRKAAKYDAWASSQINQSNAAWADSNEGADFLRLAEPIKIGHHSEHRHRALIERNHARMAKSVEHDKKAKAHASKADYWDAQAGKIDLSMPESIEYFAHELEKAVKRHAGLKDGTIERKHSYSLTYATKEVKELKEKVVLAQKLWGESC